MAATSTLPSPAGLPEVTFWKRSRSMSTFTARFQGGVGEDDEGVLAAELP